MMHFFHFRFQQIDTAISINVPGLKLQAKRQDRKVVWVVLNLSSEARQGRKKKTPCLPSDYNFSC